ncbi:MAG: site-specific DNA-methyltransferase [Nevskia sp.]|nr:site-specific DNA-methyltransferase [Nevskia sp.]
MNIRLLPGDCLDVMRSLPDGSVDAIVTDPPYGLAFMNQRWDGAGGFASSLARAGVLRAGVGGRPSPSVLYQRFCEAWARECLRLLKPGGQLLAFGGARTYHRLACGIEDAGFEVRDQVMWIYGSGFPKSQDVGKAIDKAAGARRRALGVAYRAKAMNGGAYGSDRSQRPPSDVLLTEPATEDAARWQGWGTALKPAHEPIVLARKRLSGTVARNVLAHGTGALNIAACRVEGLVSTNPLVRNAPGFRSSGLSNQGETGRGRKSLGRWPANLIHDGSAEVLAAFPDAPGAFADPSISAARRRTQHGSGAMQRGSRAEPRRGDTGSAARFFYCAKASRKDRGEGNRHPTVKPTALMRYLCRLITPPGGVILDPFTGSGSTGKAAVLEGFRFIGIERDPEYLKVARTRIRIAART